MSFKIPLTDFSRGISPKKLVSSGAQYILLACTLSWATAWPTPGGLKDRATSYSNILQQQDNNISLINSKMFRCIPVMHKSKSI